MRSTKILFVLVTFALAACTVTAQDEDEEPYLPGLIAAYSDGSKHSFRRLDEAIAFHWGEDSPDPRVAATDFQVHWRGKLFAQGAGEYRLAVHASGGVEIKLAGQVIIPKQDASGWVFSEPISLEFDRHELEVRFHKTKDPAHVSLYWSGPQFQLEPIPPRHLVHDRKESISSLYDRGELLAAALRCASCHGNDADTKSMPAPSLVHLGGNVSEDWLRNWLTDQGNEQTSITRRMPAYGCSDNEAKAITAYLAAGALLVPSPALPVTKPEKPKPGEKPKDHPSAASGERLFLTLGCLACHQVQDVGESGLFGGGNLSKIAAKRPANFFNTWLADPAKLNPDHRMPVFDLNQDERSSLSLYLASLGPSAESPEEVKPAPELIGQGRKLVSTHRCASCHALPKDPELAVASKPKPLSETSDWAKTCAASLETSQAHFGYSLSKEDQQALQAFYTVKRAGKATATGFTGRLALIQNNCLACHGREGVESLTRSLPKKLADKLAALTEKHQELAAFVPAMTPPSLNSIGDKLHEEALATTIRRQSPPLRDYLLVRMPRFPLPDDELKRLVSYFVQTDRIPPLSDAATTKPTPSEEASLSLAGSRLVSTDGFGCTSCHQVGKVVPDKAPLNARGPSLSSLDKRIRKEWYDRFLRNPARIVPRMEMPSVQIPVKGVLNEKLDPQLAALWHVLATPGFEPPEPNPVRVLRLSGDLGERPLILADVLKLQDQTITKPIVVGLPNRNNIAFDVSTNRQVAWWLGDMARQRTKGKSWYWEAGGPSILAMRPEAEISFEIEKRPFEVKLREPDGPRIEAWNGFAKSVPPAMGLLRYRATIMSPQGDNPDDSSRTVTLQQIWEAAPATQGSTGFTRRISADMPGEWLIVFSPLSPDIAKLAKRERHNRQLTMPHCRIRITKPASVEFLSDFSVRVPATDNRAAIELEYAADLLPDTPPQLPPAAATEETTVEVGQGLDARRLAVDSDLLPTGFTWRPDGKLLLCTLRGEVFVANANSTGFIKIADGLPTPYGILARTSAHGIERTLVAAKEHVIEVAYADGEDIGLNALVQASGWGYTADYHDWTAGFAEGSIGELYIGLPCQQDERPKGDAQWRGTVAKLLPRERTKDDTREFSVEVLSSGHRFPMGLAVNHDGDLFVTDNQGNYNPFNELNHVRKGAFFGFVNANDKKNKDYKVPPTTEPAINIPHPWTRSVNGICFLYTPKKLREETGKDAFGPLEGQLVGCEYDTRRLIRMSLQKIGETYQGCAYPLSREPSSPEKGFLGPIVCAVSPRGELYVGSIRESGWGAGNNVGEIVKIKFEPEKLPCGIAEVKAVKGGFSIDFLREVDAKKAADIANYSISSYRRISTPAYGGPDVDRRIEMIDSVELSANRRRVTVQLPEMRNGFVYEIQLKNLAPRDAEFFPAEAYFTLHGVP